MKSKAWVPVFIEGYENKVLVNIMSLLLGVGFLSLLAQLYIPLPFSPVPITGQTLGVSLIGLFWGSKRAAGVLLSYLMLGALGLPIFALGFSGLSFGPTLGYLIGMFFSASVIGFLSDKGFASSFSKTLITCYLGSFLVFACGLSVLYHFVPTNTLISVGVLPFLLGDLIKNTIASVLYSNAKKIL